VLRAWQGLGYNRRAVALHQAAEAIVERHRGHVPRDLDALRALPGIGEYTARAILAFAFGEDVAPVDTNIRRVLQRAVAGAPLAGRALQSVADAVVPHGSGRDWSAALMDLGATVCTSRPRCDQCPVSQACAWAGVGDDPAAVAPKKAALPFAGSNRFHRGRLLDALRAGRVSRSALAAAARVDQHERAEELAAALVADGLAQWHQDHLYLPG
jgi:A/G-specific adenine glycosylase